MRLRGFDATALVALRAAARMSWHPESKSWVLWTMRDRDEIVARLHALGFGVALRGVGS